MSDIIFKTLLLKGEAGNNIIDIKKTSSDGLVDTYTITRTDGVTTTFKVTNGKNIINIKKTGSTGLIDNYTINYNDGTSSAFSIGNGRGISGIKKTGSTGLVDTYTITYNDGTTSTFTVTNGEGVDDVRGQICTNLLNPTLQTIANNGVTFTNNGDGTYTVNGTASARANVGIQGNIAVNVGDEFRVCGGSNDINIVILYYKSNTFLRYFECAEDRTFQIPNDVNTISIELVVQLGTTVTNKVIKPMLTTDLNATYDDFVPYTGDNGRLNEDVADLVDSVKGISAITNSDIDNILNS